MFCQSSFTEFVEELVHQANYLFLVQKSITSANAYDNHLPWYVALSSKDSGLWYYTPLCLVIVGYEEN